MSKEKKEKKEKPIKAPKVRRVRGEGNVERNNAIRDFLKSLIFPVCFLALIGLGVFAIIKFVNPQDETVKIIPYGFEGDPETPIVVENDELILTMDPATTYFTVTKKSTGKEWSSYIKDADSDSRALSDEKSRMQSNLLLTFGIKSGLETIYDTKAYSVDNSIYEIEQVENGINLKYTLGKVEREYIIPKVKRVAEMDALRDKMEKNKASLVKDMYKKYDINKLKKGDDKEALLAQYPILATEPVYVLKANAREDRKQVIEAAMEEAGYTYEEYEADKALDESESDEENQLFNVEMDLRLEGDDLVVEVPFDKLEFDPSAPITLLTPLPYFGAGGKEDEGFMLVPEGGGGIIEYNNGKVAQNNYYANVYGWDMCQRRRYVIHNTRAYFNTYGHSCGDGSFLCIMEDGTSYAAVKAFIGGKLNDYNYVDAEYTLCPKEEFEIANMSSSAVYSYQTNIPRDEKIVQRYRFLDSTDYVDMAYAYRDYLESNYGDYMTLNEDEQAPVAVELVGAVDKVQQVLGVPVSLPLKLTKFKDAEDIIKDLNSLPIGKLSVKYTGWCNGGVDQKILTSVNPIWQLGSKNDLKNLATTASNLGVDLYLDGITQYEHRSNIFNGFISYRDAARLLTKERAELFNYSHVTYAAREGFKSYYLLHTGLAMEMANNLVAAAGSYGTGVSFQDIGMDLSSDFYRKEMHSREDVKNKNTELLKSMDDKKVMINMGNDYAVPYVDMITNMDLKGSEYTIIDHNVPFYQIAIHGYIDYTGNPINICGDDQEELLRSAEYGAGLYFTLMSESSFVLQKTLYSEYYGCEYAAWRTRLIDMCTRYNDELGHCFKQEMSDHEVLTDYVRCTTFADGTKVYVNYSFTEDYTAEDGTEVPTRDYVVVR
ncbi:MAG: hypothetical protein IK115_11270 [Lachnospiraceae bacterium]|nr:hypothetical protein [Lachnospiraceae bacterium]